MNAIESVIKKLTPAPKGGDNNALMAWCQAQEKILMGMGNGQEEILARKFFRPWLVAWINGCTVGKFAIDSAPRVWPILVEEFRSHPR